LFKGPHKTRRTGRRRNPWATPKTIMPNHILKNDSKIYDLLGPRTIIAKKVEKAPWKTDDPIEASAPLALNTL